MSNLTTQAGANVIEKRELYVGGSDVPTLLGINKYKTPYELALEKVGLKKSDFKGNEYTQYGNVMEPQIRDYINVVNETHFVEATKIGEGIRSNTDGYDQDQI
ncbi:YqaJ viral recombinase family protein [Thalassobacillus sp. C254]|uniref:YqaJ viral recombinase family protein n=1 Tax=Thalassobacillus sp. C254 TaxID=1225341 RepID=UPI0006D0AA1A|nr:YqaJ viral recombinase family protein [Thalassobacillus sp. C254]